MYFSEKLVGTRRYRIAAQAVWDTKAGRPYSRQVVLGPAGPPPQVELSATRTVGRLRVGDVGALVWVAEQLDVIGVINRACGWSGGPKSVSLGEMVLAVAVQRACAPAAKCHLGAFLAESMPRVFADPAELDGALVNLALNARDAMPRGGDLSIVVEERRILAQGEMADLEPGAFVAIQVRDTGLGMAGEVLARVLEPFFTTKGAGKGSGLGLSMVYGFARQSGGAMTIESELGYGTRVTLFLPAAPASVGDVPVPDRASHVRGSERVLVVEDEPDVRDIAVAFLHSLGYRSHVAETAARALDLLREHPDIDLLFTDVALGSGMNGFDLAGQAQRFKPDLPVLLTSGYEHAATRGDARPDFALLRKPYSRKAFSEAIRKAIDRG